jgi:hypothetical protein
MSYTSLLQGSRDPRVGKPPTVNLIETNGIIIRADRTPTDSLIEVDEIISRTDRAPTGNMIGGDEHGSFRITTVASNEVVGTTGSRRAMKLGADAGPRTYARRHASPGSKARALAPSGRRCARPVRKTQQIRCASPRKPVFWRKALPKLVGFSTLMALPEGQVCSASCSRQTRMTH